MTKRESIDTHIYFPPEVFKSIKKLAGLQRRSISAEIVIAVESHLALNKPTLLLASREKPGPKRNGGKNGNRKTT